MSRDDDGSGEYRGRLVVRFHHFPLPIDLWTVLFSYCVSVFNPFGVTANKKATLVGWLSKQIL